MKILSTVFLLVSLAPSIIKGSLLRHGFGQEERSLGGDPSIELKYDPQPDTVDAPGETVTFNVEVKNTGPVKVKLIKLEDDEFMDISPCKTGDWIDPGDTYKCQFDQHISGDAGDKHESVLTARVKQYGDNKKATEQKTVTVHIVSTSPPATGGIEVTKSADPSSVYSGEDVTFTVKVKNTYTGGSVKIVKIEDDKFGDLIAQQHCVKKSLSYGDTYSCDFTVKVTGSPGSTHTNKVTVEAKAKEGSKEGTVFKDSDTTDVKIKEKEEPSGYIKVTKKADKDIVSSGDTVTYTITVENKASSKIRIRTIDDDKFGNLIGVLGSTCKRTGVPKGETYTCKFEKKIQGNPGTTHKNTVTVMAKAKDGSGDKLFGSDSEEVDIKSTVPPQGYIKVTKRAHKKSVKSGDDVTYTIVIKNNYHVKIRVRKIDDDKFGDLVAQNRCPRKGLKPGQSYTCTFTDEVSGDPGTTHKNTVTVMARATDGSGDKLFGSASEEVHITGGPPPPPPEEEGPPKIIVEKWAIPEKVCDGDEVKFIVKIRNVSDPSDPVTITSLVDKKYRDLYSTCGLPITIESGEDNTCYYYEEIHGNVGSKQNGRVIAKGRDDEGVSVTGKDGAPVRIVCH